MTRIEHRVNLRPHPSDRVQAVRAISARLSRSATEIQIGFRLDGDISAIVVPPPAEPRIDTELWRHTCFELFISVDDGPAYHEFNFSPSGAWAIYAFRGYRDGAPLRDETMRPVIAVRSTAARLELDPLVRLDRVAEVYPAARLRVGLSAVIETGGGFSYWALTHPADRPDFHRAEGFSLSLEAPGS